MKQILPYVYRLTNRNTGEFYYGYRKANKVRAEEDLGIEYFTSSRYVKPRFKEFETEIVAEFFDSDSAYWFEQSLIQENWKEPGILNKKYVKIGGKEFYNCENTPEARAKISASMTGRKQSKEHSEKNRIRQIGIKKSEAHRLALCKPKTITEELKAQWVKFKNPDSMSKPRKCSCLICHKETSTNLLNKHFNDH